MVGLVSSLRALQVVWVACWLGRLLVRCGSAVPDSVNVFEPKTWPRWGQGWQ